MVEDGKLRSEGSHKCFMNIIQRLECRPDPQVPDGQWTVSSTSDPYRCVLFVLSLFSFELNIFFSWCDNKTNNLELLLKIRNGAGILGFIR